MKTRLANLKRILMGTAASFALALSSTNALSVDATHTYTLTYDGLPVANGQVIPNPYPGIAAATVTHFGVDQNIAAFEDVYFWDGLSPGNGYGNLANVAMGPSGTPTADPAFGVISITPNYPDNFVRIISCDFASLDSDQVDAASLIVVRHFPAEIYPFLNTLTIAGDVDPLTHTHIDFAPIEGPINTTVQIYWESVGGRVAIDNVHFEIVGPIPPDASVAPEIKDQPEDLTVTEPAAATFSVTATGTETLSYQWQRNGVDIGGATESSYTLSSTSAAADDGEQFTVVVSNASGSVTSVVATLTVNAVAVANLPPAVRILYPTKRDNFIVGNNIVLAAQASDRDGFVTSVEFFAGDKSLGFAKFVGSEKSYEHRAKGIWVLVWRNVPAGKYEVTARAVDNADASTDSKSVDVSVSKKRRGGHWR